MRRTHSSRLVWTALSVLGGLLLVVLAIGSAQAASVNGAEIAQVPGGIQGVLYEPDGTTPVGGGWIDIHDVSGQPWMGTDTAPNGSFSISNLPPGHYILTAHPPPASIYAASLPAEVEVLSGQWAAVNLLLTEPLISGYVRDCDALPEARIEGASVVAHTADWSVERWAGTDVNGEYKIGGLQVGVPILLQALPPEGTAYAPLEPISVTPPVANIVLELCIPPTNVVGIVHDPGGNPVPGAGIVVFREELWWEAAADGLGGFLFRGLPPGEFWIQAAPPWGPAGAGLLSSVPFTITLSQPETLVDVGVITLPFAVKTAIGHVRFVETEDGVPNAMVTAHRLDQPGYADTPTDPTGAFTLSLRSGEWHLAAEPLPPPSPPAEWIFPGPPAWIVFELPFDQPETQTATLEVVPTNAWVAGRVVCPGGSPCVDEPSHEAVWAELRREGIGSGVGLGPDYGFEIPIPDGWYELMIHVEHPELQGPPPMPVFVGPGQTLNVGDIALLLKDAKISGQVRNELGLGVPGVPVVGWQPDGFGWGWAETDAAGAYTMPVIGGEWFVEPQPGPEVPFVYRQPPRLVRVAPGGTMSGVDLALTYADARIQGGAVDAVSAERLWGLDGWATAHLLPGETFFSDAPLRDGGFALKVRGGETYAVGLDLPPHAPYVSGGVAPVAVAPAAQMTVSVPLEHKNAAIEGALVIAGTEPPEPALGVWAEVFGEDERGHWVAVNVDPDSAGYGLGVISGTWHLRAWVDPASGYAAVPTTTQAIVQAHQVASFVDFAVWPINATISGQVQRPDGTALAGAPVFARGESPFVGPFEAQAESDGNGYYELVVPEGGYVVDAALPGDELQAKGWLNPPPIDVPWVSAASPATGQDLRFRRLDGEIQGTITFASVIVVTPTHPAYVWGWADTGEWAETEAAPIAGTSTFTYVMRVVSDTVWHVGAVYEDWNGGVFYESPEKAVSGLKPSGQALQDLQLGGPWLLPQPFIVSFDGAQMQTIIMPDGVELLIPPGALVKSGTVTLFIFPTQEIHPEPGRELIGPGYEIWAIDGKGQQIIEFNKNIVMTMHYDETELQKLGLSEQVLIPVYYSTLLGHWALADSYVVDTEHDEISLHIRHFTTFGLASTERGQSRVYLPVVLRGFD